MTLKPLRFDSPVPPVTRTGEQQRNAGLREARVKPPIVRFDRGETPMEGLRRAWKARLDFLRGHHDSGVLDTDKEVHLLRLTSKRFRAYLQLVRPLVHVDSYREENRFLRDSARSLAGSRDVTVALRTIARLEEKVEGKRALKALREARRAIEESPGAAAEGRGKIVTAEAIGAALGALGESFRRFELIQARATGWPVMEGGLYHTYRRARNRFRRWEKTSDPGQAHRSRRYAKYLVFQIELLEDANPGKIEALRADLTKFETRLGKLNDLVTLNAMLNRERTNGRLSRAVEKEVVRLTRRPAKDLGKAIRKTGGRLFRRPAAGFVKGLEEDWRRWRDDVVNP